MSIWQDRTLIVSGVYYALATSKLKVPKKMRDIVSYPKTGGASTSLLENSDGSKACLVMLFDHKHQKEQIYGLLVHEAVHVWQYIKEDIGEDKPSSEFEAYSIQKIAQNLFYEYKKQMRKK